MNGGGQERGLRSGTVPTPLAVGFGAACELAKRELKVTKNFQFNREREIEVKNRVQMANEDK